MSRYSSYPGQSSPTRSDLEKSNVLTCVSSLGGRIILNTVAHPFEYAKFLIQIGHEPIAPYPTRTLFGRPAYALPNVFKYIKYIKSVDGWSGCYRGLTPKITSHILAIYASQNVAKYFKDPEDLDLRDDLSDEEQRAIFIQQLTKNIACKTASVVISHPFHVIALRCMAQFVGGEEQYSGVFGSIVAIYKEDGVQGFFAGIVPRWLGDMASLIISSTVTFIISSYLITDKELKSLTTPVVQLVTNALTYPFNVVSSCMAVNNCSLAAGLPPNMPIYRSWKDCWSHLSHTSQLNRGSSLLWRFYLGPHPGISIASPSSLSKRN